MKTKKHEKTNISNYETREKARKKHEKNRKARQRHEKTSDGSELIHHRPHVVITNTRTPPLHGQSNSGRFDVFVIFSANLIENQPFIQ